MKEHADRSLNHAQPSRTALVAGACIAAVMAGSVWSNLLSGDHRAFERSAAPDPVKVEPAPARLSAGKTSNAFPAASVNVSVVPQNQLPKADDPLGQLIMQTGSISMDAVPAAGADAGTQEAPGLIIEAQRALAALKFYSGPVDGLVGPAHEHAVRNYQATHGLPVTGIVTRPLLDHMQMTATVESATQTDIVVHKVQTELAKLGYAPGTIDGRLGEQTRAAIRVFEADRGWQITGDVSDRLLAELDGSGNLAAATSN